MAKLAEIARIDPKSCTPYEAHVEGRVERQQLACGDDVARNVQGRPAGWTEMLQWVEFAINSSPYSVTG
jgi:hypothetical protein